MAHILSGILLSTDEYISSALRITKWIRVHHNRTNVTQIFLTEPKVSLSDFETPSTCPYPEPDESIPHPHNLII
jgi:hypothetical protein